MQLNVKKPYIRDIYLAYLINGARRLRGFDMWPNTQLGWGALCLEDSLPLER